MSTIRSRTVASRFAWDLLLPILLLLPAPAPAVDLVSVTLNPTTIVSGSPLEVTIAFDGPVTTGVIFVPLTSNYTSIVDVPSFWVAEGATSWGGVVVTGVAANATLVTIQASYGSVTKTATVTVIPREPVRGVAGDLWADIILGKPDFTEVTYNEVTSRRVFNARGVLVDRSVTPNRVYVFDSGNSRVLGMSHLGTCAGGTNNGGNCTTNSDCPASTCTIQEGRGADLVLGQPDFTRSACNGDGAFQRFPLRAPASAATLCSMPEGQVSFSEQLIGANMAVDGAGNLYVPDSQNNRVLRYKSPFTTTDRIADDVWGQADFTGKECNRGQGAPDAQSLCFRSPLGTGFVDGVAVDTGGNLWVTDNANNRVLRFPCCDSVTHHPSHTADLVLGQADFTSSGPGNGLNQMWGPAAVRVDSSGSVYVADSQNARVLIFDPSFINGQFARRLNIDFGPVQTGNFGTPTGLEFDPTGGLWINDTYNDQFLFVVGESIQKVLSKEFPDFTGRCGPDDWQGGLLYSGDGSAAADWLVCNSAGSIGVDRDGSVLVSKMDDVWHFPAPIPPPGTEYRADAQIFKPYQFNVQNEVGLAGTYTPDGVVVAADQLIVADRGRILYWNHPPHLTNGQTADGYVGTTDPRSHPAWQIFGRLREDGGGRLWATWNEEIRAYSLPLHTGDSPSMTIVPPLPVLGGGSVTWDARILAGGIAPVGAGDKIWVVDNVSNRVFRVRDALTPNRTVDIVLGQTSASGTDCNQGHGGDNPSQTSLCYPASIRLDPDGNLYVSDSGGEAQGNMRVLEFDAGLFPDSPTQALFATPASRVFGTGGSFTTRGCSGFEICADFREPGFSSDGQMVGGGGGYANPPFPSIYTNPLVSQRVSGFLNDYYSCPGSATFDSSNNLYVTDSCRARLLIYLSPLASPPTPPTITGIGPNTGSTAGGTPVTITGTGFQSGATVSLGGVAATGVVVAPPNTITATTGAHAAGSVDVVVTNPDSQSGTLTNGFLYVVPPPAPTIRSFTPTSGIAGASVTINGTNFTAVVSVKFNGVPATFAVNSAVSITATVPAAATTGKITVTTMGGAATSTGTFSIKPSITGFTPGSGAVGISVTITGIAFNGATSVKFNGTTAGFTVDSSTQITATVPTNATTGKITVTTPVGTATSATNFTVAPRITSFTPTSGLIGASVTINGANFTGATSVTFNGTSATYTVNSATRITATVPSGATTGPIGVTTPAGAAISTGTFSIKPSITSFTPTSGAVGISVTITGIAFNGATSVKFNGTTAGFTVDSSTQITATVPAGATTGKITVTTPVGTATSATNFTVAPRITSFTPTSGLIGASVAINGANFTGATSVTFNGTSATYTVNSATRITATVPSGATTGPIRVTTSAGTGTSSSNFTVR